LAERRRGRSIGARSLAARAVLLSGLLALVGGCGSSPPATTGQSPSSAAPASSGPAVGSPQATRWPREVADSIIRLGAMHNDLGTAIGDLSAAVQSEDVAEMKSVATALAAFLDGNLASARGLEPTFPELSDGMVGALTTIRDAATAIVKGIDQGDGAAVTNGFTEITRGMAAYARVQPSVAQLVPEAIRQTGGLVR
jgi:hypothetical protein